MIEILCVWSAFAFVVPCAQLTRAWQERVEAGVLGDKVDLASVDTSKWAVKDAEAAIQKAQHVLGVASGACRTAAELIAMKYDNTPFLAVKTQYRMLWQVVVHDWKLKLPSALPTQLQNARTRTFDVLVRPEDGRVVKIRSRWPQGEPMMSPEPDGVEGTCILYAGGYSTYHDFPDRDPGVSLLQALDSVRGQVLTAKQILALPVVWSNVQYQTPRVVWAINLRGVMPLLGNEENPEPKYEWYYIVDGDTGKTLVGGNVLQPREVFQNWLDTAPE